jgi:hypothetical protein
MAYLELDTRLAHQFHDLPGLIHGIGHGLFHKNMLAFQQSRTADLEMEGGRGNNVHGINGVYQRVSIGEPLEVIFGGHFRGHGIIGVKETDQLNAIDLLPVVKMELTQMPCAENA